MPPTTVLIRHADVPSGMGPNPALSADGLARAQQLRHLLGDADIEAIFVTSLLRTQQTAEPIAADLQITPTVTDDVDALVTAIRARPSASRVLVIGHSNTVPGVISGLGGPTIAAIGATEFDNLFVLTQDDLIHLRYGVQDRR